jgi:16S rRNA (guanine527-N7)-methyltransferase
MPELLHDNTISDTLSAYGVATSPASANSIRVYISMLLRWNGKISLTTVVDPTEILKFHFGESLFAISKVPISHGRLADVGSGAGFPGLPIAMFLSDLEVVLIESNLKKATFLSEVIRELKIVNVSVRRERVEEITENSDFTFVTARALGQNDQLLRWSSRSLKSKGKVVLWLGEADAASVSNTKGWQWTNKIPIPESERRVLLVGAPQLPTD